MSKPTKKEKKLVDIGKMYQIEASFWLLEHYTPWDDDCNEPEDYFEDISPLIIALKNKEYNLIAASLPKRTMSREAKIKLQTRIFVNNLISRPQNVLGFEMEITKGDIILIMERVFKTLHKSIPTNTRTLSNWWRSIGLPVEQRRVWNPDPVLEKWIQIREQRIDSGEITFTSSGEPLENGKQMFRNFPNNLRPLFDTKD